MTAKPMRIIPPLTEEEIATATNGVASRNGSAVVGKDTLKRVDEALRWHDKRARERAS